MVRFGQRLSKTIGEHDLTIGEMAEDLANGPLAGSGGPIGTGITKRIQKFAESRGGGGDDLAGVAGAEKGRVRVHKVILQFWY